LQKNSHELDLNKLSALLNGRCGVFPMTEVEQRAWPMALRWAALRFYLSRLYDYHLPRQGKKLEREMGNAAPCQSLIYQVAF